MFLKIQLFVLFPPFPTQSQWSKGEHSHLLSSKSIKSCALDAECVEVTSSENMIGLYCL